MRPSLRILTIVSLTAAAVFTAGAIAGLREAPPVRSAGTTTVPADRQAQAIARAQDRLRQLPRDYQTWAALGVAYVERARVTADPSLYPKASGALAQSLKVRPEDNGDALVGLGALANARHDFGRARTFALDAIKLNPYDADAYGVLADAHTQLGEAALATAAVQKMLDLRPGLAGYARASYDLEQRGQLPEATALMRQALDAAADPADIAFCRNQLGDLAWSQGDLPGAEREYSAGLAADPGYQPLLRGRARVDAASGRLDAAIASAGAVAARTPTPDTLLEYAELLRAAGRPAQSQKQLALADAAHRIFQANGGTDDLAGAQIALARGDAAKAVKLARAEWSRRPFADVADVLAQSLHAAGRDREALAFARRAEGSLHASYAYHLAIVALSLGDRTTARDQLRRVRALNPYFSVVDGPTAARALAALEAQP